MSDSIEAIKSRSSCVDIFRRFWPSHYRERGNVRCPWHEDRQPSAQLDHDCFYCHACGFKYDAIDLYQHGAGVNRKEALKLLSDELGISGSGDSSARRPPGGRRKTAPNPKHKPSNEFIKTWNKLCKNTFHADAVAYLEETRQIKGLLPTLLERELIAFDPKFKAWNHETQSKDIWQAIAFPLVNADKSEMLGIQYVRIDGKGKKFATGTNGKDCFFFYGTGNEYCVVTEAVIDGLSVYAACNRTLDLLVCSIMSGGKGYEEKLAQLKALNPVLFFDNDDVGRAITALACKTLGGKCRLVDWSLAPEGMKDCNDLLKAGHADVIERMVRTSRIPTESEVKELDTDEDILVGKIEELNQCHAVVMVGGRCVVINEIPDPAFGGISVSYSSMDDFRNCYRNQKVWVPCGEGKTKQVDIGKVWLESDRRRQYKGVTFHPGTTNNGYYNLFRGFAVDPKKGDWRLFRDHIFHVIASGNREHFSYLIAWMAHTVQHCGDFKPGVTIVLRGGQGSGKGCFATIFGNLFGTHFKHITQVRQLTGQFNDHLKNAVLVFVDEGFWAGDKQSEGALKAMISEDRIAVEPKGKDVFYVRNYIRIIIASNNRWVVPAGLGERRFFVLDVSPRHMQDQEYFQAIFRQMDDGGYAAMMHDLLDIDIGSFNLFDYPRTTALFDQIHQSMPSVQKFWFEKLRSFSTADTHGGFPTYFVTSKLREEYVEFCQEIGERHPVSDRVFTIEMKRMCPGIVRERKTNELGKREWTLWMPSLEEAREKFQAFVGKAPIDWDDDQENWKPMARDGPSTFVSDIAGVSHLDH